MIMWKLQKKNKLFLLSFSFVLTVTMLFLLPCDGKQDESDDSSAIKPETETAKLADLKQFQEGVLLQADGKVIGAGAGTIGHLVPVVTDWNEDGKKDLLVGQFKDGKISLYLNTGTDSAPELKFQEYLKAGGAEISLPYG